MKAAPNRVVKITYELRTEPNGEVMDSADFSRPFSFLFGHGNVLDKFETSLAEKAAGDNFAFVLTPEEGYGTYEAEAVLKLSKEVFKVDGVIQNEMLFVGNVIPLQDQNGQPFQGIIKVITDADVTVDLNHPFAGKTLHFTGMVLEVRDAHEEELAHGHVHEGGHHHH